MRFLKKRESVDPNLFVSNSGSRKKKLRSPFYDGRKLTLIESGEIDIQDEINSHARECDMNFILSRLNQGDFTVLNNQSPMFADFHNLPTSFREVLDVGLNAERIFNTLPVDIRKQFDNDYRLFVSQAGTADWYKLLNVDPSGKVDSFKPLEGGAVDV